MLKTYVLCTDILQSDEVYAEYYRKMSIDRQKKADKFYFPKDKKLCVGASILLERGLQEYGLHESDVHIGKQEKGKPYLKDYPDIHFNLSHSEEYVAVAFSDCEVGVDIEKISSLDMDIARQFFFRTEYEAIQRQESEEERKNTFYRLWTLKESFMKQTGLGMSLGLDEFEIILENPIRVKQKINQKIYKFKEYEITGYKMAVCSEIR